MGGTNRTADAETGPSRRTTDCSNKRISREGGVSKRRRSRLLIDKELIFSYNSLQSLNYNHFCAQSVPPDIGENVKISSLSFPNILRLVFLLLCCFAWLLTSENIPVALSTADCSPNKYFPTLYKTQVSHKGSIRFDSCT